MYVGASNPFTVFESDLSVNGENEYFFSPIKIVIKGFEDEISLTLDPQETTEELKEKIGKCYPDLPKELMLLMCSDKPLEDGKSLEEQNVKDTDTIYLSAHPTNDNREKKFGGIHFEFNKLENQILQDYSPTAPDYRIVSRGINLTGRCTTVGCEAQGRYVWVRKYFGIFEIPWVSADSQCPLCNKNIKEITNLGFSSCHYKMEGIQTNGRLLVVEGDTTKEKFTTYQQGDNTEWRCLRVTTTPLNG